LPLSYSFVVDQSHDGHDNAEIHIVTEKYLFIINCTIVVMNDQL